MKLHLMYREALKHRERVAVEVKRISNLHNFGLVHQYIAANLSPTMMMITMLMTLMMMMTTFQLGQSMIPLLSQSAQQIGEKRGLITQIRKELQYFISQSIGSTRFPQRILDIENSRNMVDTILARTSPAVCLTSEHSRVTHHEIVFVVSVLRKYYSGLSYDKKPQKYVGDDNQHSGIASNSIGLLQFQ